MDKRGGDPLIFAAAFIKAGGLQVPGFNAPQPIKDRIGSCVLLSLAERWGPRYPFDDPQWAFDTVVRETNRALTETMMRGAEGHPDVAGFRIVIGENVVKRSGCELFARAVDFGLGPGIYPRDEIPILPACCDRAYLEIVFSDEITPVNEPDQPPSLPYPYV